MRAVSSSEDAGQRLALTALETVSSPPVKAGVSNLTLDALSFLPIIPSLGLLTHGDDIADIFKATKKSQAAFKSTQQRKQLEKLTRQLGKQLKGKQKDAFRRALEREKLPGQQFIEDKGVIQSIFEEIIQNV